MLDADATQLDIPRTPSTGQVQGYNFILQQFLHQFTIPDVAELLGRQFGLRI